MALVENQRKINQLLEWSYLFAFSTVKPEELEAAYKKFSERDWEGKKPPSVIMCFQIDRETEMQQIIIFANLTETQKHARDYVVGLSSPYFPYVPLAYLAGHKDEIDEIMKKTRSRRSTTGR